MQISNDANRKIYGVLIPLKCTDVGIRQPSATAGLPTRDMGGDLGTDRRQAGIRDDPAGAHAAGQKYRWVLTVVKQDGNKLAMFGCISCHIWPNILSVTPIQWYGPG